MKRLRRVMAPRADGTYLLPQEMIDKFADVHGGGRASVMQMWNGVGKNKDWALFSKYNMLVWNAGFIKQAWGP